MKLNKNALLFVLSLLVLGAFVFWQSYLFLTLFRQDISCGGDYSYDVSCPFGSYCASLGLGPIAGGVCRPWLWPIFKAFTSG